MPRVNSIRRTITTTACLGQHVNEFGEFEDFCDVVPRAVTEAQASRILRARWNDESIVINHVDHETHVYMLSVEEFIAYAHEITPEDSKKEN